MLVFDVTDRQSFDELRDRFIEKTKQLAKSSIKLAIIGNKCDMVLKREVAYDEAQNLAA